MSNVQLNIVDGPRMEEELQLQVADCVQNSALLLTSSAISKFLNLFCF